MWTTSVRGHLETTVLLLRMYILRSLVAPGNCSKASKHVASDMRGLKGMKSTENEGVDIYLVSYPLKRGQCRGIGL